MKINLNKPHPCHVCKKEGKFFYKKWWCGHDKYLIGVCNDKGNEFHIVHEPTGKIVTKGEL